jgi:hypothetical protein
MIKYIALLSLMPIFANSCEQCIQDLFEKIYFVREEMDFDFYESPDMRIYRNGLVMGLLEAGNIMRKNHCEASEALE